MEMTGNNKSGPARDLEAAKAAYADGDAAASRTAHDVLLGQAGEQHDKTGDWIKSMVYGGLDGIITTFAVVAGASGGGLGVNVILILGFSNMFADALSMGVGDALSTKAENDRIMRERQREAWELEHYKEGEIKEMVELYEERGMGRKDAEIVIRLMAKYEDFFVDVMMVEELGLQVPDEDENPWFDGFITFCSFVFFGIFPLLAYVIFAAQNLLLSTLFGISCGFTGIMLFLLGVFKSRFTGQKWWISGTEIFLLGGGTAAVSFLIGWIVEDFMASSSAAGGLH